MTVVALRAQRRSTLWRGRCKPAPPLDLPSLEVKSAEGWRYQWHRAVLERRDLSRSELAVAGALMHAFRLDRGCAEIAFTTLAHHAGCTRRAVTSAIGRLRALGLIVAVNEGERIRGRPTRATHRYRLTYRDRGVT